MDDLPAVVKNGGIEEHEHTQTSRSQFHSIVLPRRGDGALSPWGDKSNLAALKPISSLRDRLRPRK